MVSESFVWGSLLDAMAYTQRVMSVDKGLGDTVARIVKAAGFYKKKKCKECERRQKRLNEMFPYRRKKKK